MDTMITGLITHAEHNDHEGETWYTFYPATAENQLRLGKWLYQEWDTERGCGFSLKCKSIDGDLHDGWTWADHKQWMNMFATDDGYRPMFVATEVTPDLRGLTDGEVVDVCYKM